MVICLYDFQQIFFNFFSSFPYLAIPPIDSFFLVYLEIEVECGGLVAGGGGGALPGPGVHQLPGPAAPWCSANNNIPI